MNTKTINLVGDSDCSRAILFSKLLKESKLFKQIGKINSQINREADYNIIFSFKDLKKLENILLPKKLGTDGKFIILDINEDLYDNPKIGSLMQLLTVCSNFVTCSNEILQEKIYEVTGRLASIINNPIDQSNIKKPNIKNTSLFAWYGSIVDVFSVYKYKNNKDLTIALLTGKLDSPNVVLVNSNKKLSRLLNKFDVFFLPETPTLEGEVRRLEKIKEIILEGKAVVSDITKIPSKKILNDNVTKSQKILIEEQGFSSVIKQLEWALEQTPKDDFLEFVNAV